MPHRKNRTSISLLPMQKVGKKYNNIRTNQNLSLEKLNRTEQTSARGYTLTYAEKTSEYTLKVIVCLIKKSAEASCSCSCRFVILSYKNYWCCSRNKSFTVFTGLKVLKGTSTKTVFQSLMEPFHKPGSSKAFKSFPFLLL